MDVADGGGLMSVVKDSVWVKVKKAVQKAFMM